LVLQTVDPRSHDSILKEQCQVKPYAQATDSLCRELRIVLPPQSLLDAPDEVIDQLIAALLSPAGKNALKLQIDDLAQSSRIRLQRWWPERLEKQSQALDPELTQQIGAAMRPIIERLSAAAASSTEGRDTTSSVTTLGMATAMLKNLAKDYNVPVQVIEALDNIQGLSATDLASRLGNVPVEGLLAATLGFAISATTNTAKYRDGRIRWDDAIDAVGTDTVKAGLTGVLVSALATSLALSGPAAIAVVILVAPLIYAAVSAVVDQVYLRLLGGHAIASARSAHLDYLQVADVIRRDLVPRLRQMNSVGALVDALHRISVDSDDRVALRNVVRQELPRIANRSAESEALVRSGREFESYALESIGAWASHSFRAESGATSLVSLSEIAHLSAEVHRIYWMEYAVNSSFKRVSPESVCKAVEASQGIRGEDGARGQALRALVKHLASLEASRPSPADPIQFETKWEGMNGPKKKTEDYAVFASDVLDLAYCLYTLQGTAWTWESEIRSVLRLTKDSVRAVKRNPAGAPFGWAPEYNPREDRVVNKHYVNGLGEKLLAGRMRLFRYHNENVRSTYPSFIAADASDETPQEQCQRIQRSLRQFHPSFRADRDVLSNLTYVDDVAGSLADGHSGVTPLTLQGVRVYCIGKYTATYKVASTDEDRLGEAFLVPVEGYFRSLGEAKAAFRSVSEKIKLIGVRPGSLVLPDRLRKQLRDLRDHEKDLFLLQNQLLGRLAEGLIILDEVSNLTEARLAKLAGTGVFLSWWWSLSGRVRRELVEALSDEQVQQAIRIELMEALLEVQRVHILSHEFFQETIFAAHAKHQEQLAQRAANGVSMALPGGAV
jgi:hypothetical protein